MLKPENDFSNTNLKDVYEIKHSSENQYIGDSFEYLDNTRFDALPYIIV